MINSCLLPAVHCSRRWAKATVATCACIMTEALWVKKKTRSVQ